MHGGSGGDVFNSSLAEALGIDHDLGEEGDNTFLEQDGSADTVNGGADTDTCTCDAIDTLLNIP